MGTISRAEISYPSGAHEFTPGFQWGSCYSIFSFMCMFCRSLFVLLYLFFCHCIVYSSSIYGFWFPIWYLQTLLATCECYICYTIILWLFGRFKYLQILKKLYSIFFLLSVALAWCRYHICESEGKKHKIYELNREYANNLLK
jgi:hypothetical protein